MIRLVAICSAFLLAACPVLAGADQAKPVSNDQSITVLSGIGFGPLHAPATPVDDDNPLPTKLAVRTSSYLFQATAAGTGYATGDLIDHVIVTNATGAVTANYWINTTQGLKLANAPANGTVAMATLNVSNKPDQRTYSLASNATLAAGTCGSPVLIDISAQYGWVYQFSGSSTIMLKFRGPDGSTYLTSQYTATATGSAFVPILAGSAGAAVQVCNTGSAAISALNTTLAS